MISLSENIIFRPYMPGDEEKIVELLNRVFKGWPGVDTELSSLDYWIWKFMKNPIHKSYVSVGVDGERIVSSHHNIVLNIKIQDQIIKGGTAVDFAVDPEYRGMGLSQKTSQETHKQRYRDDHKFTYFITRNPILIKRFAGSKDRPPTPRFPFDIVNLTRIVDVDLHFEKIPVKNRAVIKAGVKTLKALKRIKQTPDYSGGGLMVKEISRFDEQINELLGRVNEGYEFIVVRDHVYLNWKYAYPRLGDYRIYTVEEDQRTYGYMVLRINRYNPDYPIGYIVDLLTDMEKPVAAHLLVQEAIDYFDSNQINITNCQLVRGHPYEQMLLDHGFLDSRIKINLYTTTPDQGVDLKKLESVDPSKVYLSWGDHDALPVGLSPHE